MLHILYHDDVSGFKIGWIILILQLPVMGGLLYLLFGGKLPLHRMRRKAGRATHANSGPCWGRTDGVRGAARGRRPMRRTAANYITATGGYPVCMDSGREILSPLGEEMYADMLRALEAPGISF